jgi:hypothetical protein
MAFPRRLALTPLHCASLQLQLQLHVHLCSSGTLSIPVNQSIDVDCQGLMNVSTWVDVSATAFLS